MHMLDKSTGDVFVEEPSMRIGRDFDKTAFMGSALSAKAEIVIRNAHRTTFSALVPIDGLSYKAYLFYSAETLMQVHLAKFAVNTSWNTWSLDSEPQQKMEYETILRKDLGEPPHEFSWGEASADFDQRSGYSCIIVRYKRHSPV